jgi:hypothetical protein
MASRVLLSSLLVVIGATATACQPNAMQRPPHVEQPALTTVDGSVLGVDGQPAERTLARNVRLRVKPEKGEPVDVDLAPGWYLGEHGLTFSPEERVQIEGTSGTQAGRTVFVARKVRRGQTSVVLRDAEGKPTWTEPARQAE